jgi:hypothetical protein
MHEANMTIKQSGGVFGRNPTFNDVTIEGQLTFDGDIDINSDLTVDGTLKADDLRLGSIVPSYNVLSSARNAGGSFEWGHSNSSGYPSTMGAESGSGSPYIAFNAGPGTSSNTYKTLGILGTVIKTDTSGNLRIGRLTTASADNQTPVESAVFTNNGNLQFPSGQGIDFSPTSGTGTSELFDDYEEGLFDVTMSASTSGTVTLDYTRLAYTKIGRMVYVNGEIRVSAVSSPVGDITIGSLPFTNSGLSQRSSRTSFFVEANSLTGSPTGIVQGFLPAGGTAIDIRLVNNFSFTSLASYLQANTAFKFCFAYTAA